MKEHLFDKRTNGVMDWIECNNVNGFKKWTNDMEVKQVYKIIFQQVHHNHLQKILVYLRISHVKQYLLLHQQ